MGAASERAGAERVQGSGCEAPLAVRRPREHSALCSTGSCDPAGKAYRGEGPTTTAQHGTVEAHRWYYASQGGC